MDAQRYGDILPLLDCLLQKLLQLHLLAEDYIDDGRVAVSDRRISSCSTSCIILKAATNGLFSWLNHQIFSWLFCHNDYLQHFPCARVKPEPSLKYRADHIEHFDVLQDEQNRCNDRSIREFESNKSHYSMAKQYRRPSMQMPLHYCCFVYSLENFLIVAILFIFMLFPDDISFLKWKAPQCRHTLSISHFKYWHRRSLTSGIFRSSSLLLLLSFLLSMQTMSLSIGAHTLQWNLTAFYRSAFSNPFWSTKKFSSRRFLNLPIRRLLLNVTIYGIH